MNYSSNIKRCIKRQTVVLLAFLLLAISIPFNVYANGQLPVYDSLPDYATLSTSGVYVARNDDINYYFAVNTDNIDYFYCSTPNDTLMFFVANKSSNPFVSYQNSAQGVPYGTNAYKFNQNNRVYFDYLTLSTSTFESTSMPYIGSFNDTAAALQYYYNNNIDYPPAVVPAKYPFTLQNGYLFVYDLGSSSASYSFDLSSKSEEYSNIGSNPFPDTNQSYWFSDSLPEIDETTIPASGAAIIQWDKGDNTNIFGQTQNMVASIFGTSTGRYLYIYNPPVHYNWSGSSNPTASEVVNYPMTINGVSDSDTWYVYDSIARLTDFNQGGIVTGTITGEQVIGSVTSDGAVSLNTSSGAIYTQSSGGSTDISGANGGSIAENINGLKQTLDNFLNQFIQLLSAPISHIQQLINAGSNFMNTIIGLFSWLPESVSTTLLSALVVMIVIGIFKMLL